MKIRNRFLSLVAGLTLGAGVAVAHAGVVTETTTYQGTVTEVIPGSSTLVVTSSASEPRRYVYTEKTTFVDELGNVVTRESIQNQPVVVHYNRTGDLYEVSRVVVQKPAPVIERRIETEVQKAAPVVERRIETETVTEID